jgi:hypothetical protein
MLDTHQILVRAVTKGCHDGRQARDGDIKWHVLEEGEFLRPGGAGA